MLTNYGEDYFKRLSQNKDVFIYGALSGAFIYWIALKYIANRR
jgi:hypothetical protein